MNYRHAFHAGNFADVVKHAILVPLFRALQQKEAGFLYLDTHAGRGAYDLSLAARGDSLARTPEWPDGVGRVLEAATLSPTLEAYRQLVLAARRPDSPYALPGTAWYPGSPWIARQLARPQDRLALCELHPEEHDALDALCGGRKGTAVHLLDGYTSLKAMLPPPERRALVLIDPPFESQTEFLDAVDGLREGLRRFGSGTYVLWYPLTERARLEEFYADFRELLLPPTWIAEVAIAGPATSRKLRGCGVAVLNPPWKIDKVIGPLCAELAQLLAQEPGGSGTLRWVMEEP